jgi:HSP20 family molecular chaperone IbpA
MTTDLFNLVWKNWDRPMKEVSGYQKIATDYGYLIVANALGISKDDLKVELTREELLVTGKTTIEDIDFTNSVNYRFIVGRKLYEEIEHIEYEMVDGLAYIRIYTKPEVERKVKITYKG